MSNPFLQCHAICKNFSSHSVLDHLDLTVAAGEFMSLLGPSGCGKTTLLRIVAGLEKADSGTVWLDRENVTTQHPSLRGVGIVFQSYALYPNMNALENVAFGLRARGDSSQQSKAKAAVMLEKIGLGSSLYKTPAQLSGGQQQRVALARVLVLSPRILLLDEPFSALDARIRFQMRLQVREMQRELGITTILVTHDQEEAMMISDRIALLHQGKMEQLGTPREIYQKPSTRFVADFVGAMNFMAMPNNSISDAQCEYAFRPELVEIGEGEGPGLRMPGRIVDLEFRGGIYRLIAETQGERLLADVYSGNSDLENLHPGQEIQLFVADRHVIRFTGNRLLGQGV